MALVYTEEQQLLKDSAKEFLAERSPVGAFRELRDTGNPMGFSRAVWEEMAELGWTGIVIPEEYDGLDFGYVGAGVIFEEMGRTLAPSPLFASAILSATLINRGGNAKQKQDLLPEIAAGERIVASAIEESGRHAPANTSMVAERSDSGYRLTGNKCYVLDGHVADTLIVLARTSGDPGNREGLTLFILDAQTEGVSHTHHLMVDGRNADRVELAGVVVDESAVLGQVGAAMDLLEPALDVGQCILAAEMLGIAQEAFERTIGYLKERKQFGVPIGAFQALQHRAAILFGEIELVKSVVPKALQAADEASPHLPFLASTAKAKACSVVQATTNESIQMHGGIGMTDEFDIGFFIKRARVAEQTFGDYSYHADRIASIKGY